MLFLIISIVKQAFFAYVNNAWIRSWNQPVLNNEGNVTCSRKQRVPLMGIGLTTDRLPPTMSEMNNIERMYYCSLTITVKPGN